MRWDDSAEVHSAPVVTSVGSGILVDIQQIGDMSSDTEIAFQFVAFVVRWVRTENDFLLIDDSL